MSPTLLEGLAALILLVVAWQIGTQLAPLIFRALRRANTQLDRVSQDLAVSEQTTVEKEEEDAKPQSE